MRRSLLVLIALTTSFRLPAQYVQSFPWTENFETSPTCGTSCGNACALSASDFSNTNDDDVDWAVDAFGTASSSTGPTANGGADHAPGVSGGRYVYTEASSCANSSAHLVSPFLDLSLLTTPRLAFWYHMYGNGMGTMHLDIDTAQGGGAWILDVVPAWTDNLDAWQLRHVNLESYSGMDSVRFRVRGIIGTSLTSDMALDDVAVYDSVFSVVLSPTFVTCAGMSDGSISATPTFGVPPYSFLWSGGQTTSAISNLANGTYSVTVTDANGATASAGVDLITPALSVNASEWSTIVCDYDLGLAHAHATGGTPFEAPYLLLEDTGLFSPLAHVSPTELLLADDQLSGSIPIGFDFVFYGDSVDAFRVSSNGFITFNTASNSSGCCSGAVIPGAAAPNALIALNWTDLDPDNGSDGKIYFELQGEQPYRKMVVTFDSVAVYGGGGRVYSQAILYESSHQIEVHSTHIDTGNSVQTQGIEDFSGASALTVGGRNGAYWSAEGHFVRFYPNSGGLDYRWSNGVSDTINPRLTSGTYIVTVWDAQGCTAMDTAFFPMPVSRIRIEPEVHDISCFGSVSGSIIAHADSGVLPYLYQWSNGQAASVIEGLAKDTYGLTVTDAVGCLDSVGGLFVDEPPLLLAQITESIPTDCPEARHGRASALASGGVPPYGYFWLPSGIDGPMADSLSAGVHQLAVTDANGCQAILSAVILAQFPAAMVDLGPDLVVRDGEPVNLSGGNNSQFLWSTGSTASSITAVETGTYWVAVANGFGCSASDTVSLVIWPTGVGETNPTPIDVFPNPVRGQMNIRFGDARGTAWTVEVYDLRGRLVLSERWTDVAPGEIRALDTRTLTAAPYLLRLNNEHHALELRVVVE